MIEILKISQAYKIFVGEDTIYWYFEQGGLDTNIMTSKCESFVEILSTYTFKPKLGTKHFSKYFLLPHTDPSLTDWRDFE